MRIDEIRRKQRDPRNPWRKLSENVLRSAGEGARCRPRRSAARASRARPLRQEQTTAHFDVIWVWETFIRTAGEDWTFISIGDKHMLTEVKAGEEVYPEQDGERPLALGYGSFEAFRIFPMRRWKAGNRSSRKPTTSATSRWTRFKQNIMPVTKVVRGRHVDLDQLKRRGQGTSIMVTDKDDVTWEKSAGRPPACRR
jgi:hypothetical protein